MRKQALSQNLRNNWLTNTCQYLPFAPLRPTDYLTYTFSRKPVNIVLRTFRFPVLPLDVLKTNEHEDKLLIAPAWTNPQASSDGQHEEGPFKRPLDTGIIFLCNKQQTICKGTAYCTSILSSINLYDWSWKISKVIIKTKCMNNNAEFEDAAIQKWILLKKD